MLSMLLLLPFFLCNAQWPQQSVGSEDIEPIPRPSDQPDNPYQDASQWVENIPNLDLVDEANRKASKKSRICFDQIPQPAKIERQEFNNLRKNQKFSNSSERYNFNNEETSQKIKSLLKPLEFPISSVYSQIAENITSTGKNSIEYKVSHLAHQEPAIRNNTDQFMNQFNLLYLNLATDETDNEVRIENSYKYGMSVILRFLLEFYRIFRKLSSNQIQLRMTNADVYGISYDKAIDVMKDKKILSPLQISAPVRRSADIFKSILYESVTIIQTKCSMMDPNLKCIIVFLAHLISEAMNCSNIWYHAFVHLLALENIRMQDSFVYKIAQFDRFKEIAYFENIFDFIIEKLQEYREVGRVQLSVEAIFFTMLADLQENGLLDCFSIVHLYD